MNTRTLGPDGPEVSQIGLGCMGMSAFYGQADEGEARATIARALELGCNFLDTSDMYGPHTNEELVGSAIASQRDDVFLATKFGIKLVEEGNLIDRVIDGSRRVRAQRVRRVAGAPGHRSTSTSTTSTASTRTRRSRRPSARWPSWWQAGKVRYLGLSEASAETIRRAHAVHPIAAVQTEYSLWTRDVEAEILPTLQELGIALVAYSPLGRGFLSGRFSLDGRARARATTVATARASPARTSSRTWRWPSACASWRPRREHHAGPAGARVGARTRASTSCRSRAPSA